MDYPRQIHPRAGGWSAPRTTFHLFRAFEIFRRLFEKFRRNLHSAYSGHQRLSRDYAATQFSLHSRDRYETRISFIIIFTMKPMLFFLILTLPAPPTLKTYRYFILYLFLLVIYRFFQSPINILSIRPLYI
jgi:hypothetical protein